MKKYWNRRIVFLLGEIRPKNWSEWLQGNIPWIGCTEVVWKSTANSDPSSEKKLYQASTSSCSTHRKTSSECTSWRAPSRHAVPTALSNSTGKVNPMCTTMADCYQRKRAIFYPHSCSISIHAKYVATISSSLQYSIHSLGRGGRNTFADVNRCDMSCWRKWWFVLNLDYLNRCH